MPVSLCRKVLEMGPSQLFGPMAAFILIALSPAVLGTGVSEVDSLLGEGRPVLVYIYQDWCHFCAEQVPIIDQIEEELTSEITFLRVDAGQEPEIAAALGAAAYPTTLIITGSDETDCIRLRFTGLTDGQTLRQYLNEAIDGTLLPAAAVT